MHRPFALLLYLQALLAVSCAGRLDPAVFLLPPPELDPGDPPVRTVRTTRHPETGGIAARWVVLTFIDGRVVRDGREERFHPDGTPSALRHFEAGTPVGEWRQWHVDGTLRSTYEYVAGEATPMSFFHPDGRISARGMAVAGAREGEWMFWYPGGGLRQSGRYVGGLREGAWTIRWPCGGLRSRGRFTADARVGEWKHWPDQPPTAESAWQPDAPVSSGR